MNCPYCTSTIADHTLVCPQCTRDLYLFKPLLAQLQAIDGQMKQIEARLGLMENLNPSTLPSHPPLHKDKAKSLSAWSLLLPALLVLILAHALIIIALDLPTVWLRVASFLIPLPFGLLLLRGSGYRIGRRVIATAAVAVLAVGGMSATVAAVDGTPVLPANTFQWREFLSYALSIFLSFCTGMLIGWHRALVHRHTSALLRNLGGAISGVAHDPKQAQAQLDALRALLTGLTAFAAALGSLFSGLYRWLS